MLGYANGSCSCRFLRHSVAEVTPDASTAKVFLFLVEVNVAIAMWRPEIYLRTDEVQN